MRYFEHHICDEVTVYKQLIITEYRASLGWILDNSFSLKHIIYNITGIKPQINVPSINVKISKFRV